jgi:hypothetical protein
VDFIEACLDYHLLQALLLPGYFPPYSNLWIRITTNNQGLIDYIMTGLATKTVFAGTVFCSE